MRSRTPSSRAIPAGPSHAIMCSICTWPGHTLCTACECRQRSARPLLPCWPAATAGPAKASAVVKRLPQGPGNSARRGCSLVVQGRRVDTPAASPSSSRSENRVPDPISSPKWSSLELPRRGLRSTRSSAKSEFVVSNGFIAKVVNYVPWPIVSPRPSPGFAEVSR